jgi:hypothetical protein
LLWDDGAEGKAASLAGGSTIDICAASVSGNLIHITGSGTINSFSSCPNPGAEREIIFDGIFTITHASATIDLPGRANVTTMVGNRVKVVADTTTRANVVRYTRASGAPLGVTNSYLFSADASVIASTAPDITGINVNGAVNEVRIHLEGVSQNSANTVLTLQLGDSGGIETSGYSGGGSGETHVANTAGSISARIRPSTHRLPGGGYYFDPLGLQLLVDHCVRQFRHPRIQRGRLQDAVW